MKSPGPPILSETLLTSTLFMEDLRMSSSLCTMSLSGNDTYVMWTDSWLMRSARRSTGYRVPLSAEAMNAATYDRRIGAVAEREARHGSGVTDTVPSPARDP